MGSIQQISRVHGSEMDAESKLHYSALEEGELTCRSSRQWSPCSDPSIVQAAAGGAVVASGVKRPMEI